MVGLFVVTLEQRKRFRGDETPARELVAGGFVARVKAVLDQIPLPYCNGALLTWGGSSHILRYGFVPYTVRALRGFLTPYED